MRRIKSTLIVTCVTLLAMTLASACGQASPTPTPATEAETTAFTTKVSATAQVVPVRWSTLSLQASGVAEEIPVTEGQGVAEGQLLVRLSGGENARAALAAAELELLSAQQALDDLYENHDQMLAAAEQRLANAKKALDKAKDQQTWKQYQPGDKDSVDIAWGDVVEAKQAVEDAEELFSFYADRPEDDPDRARALKYLASMRKRLETAERNYNYLVSLPDEIEKGIADANLKAAQAEVDAAQREVDKLKEGPDPDQLSLAKARLANAEEQVKAAKKALENLELKAPFDGTVSRLYIRENEWVTPGVPVLVLADLTEMQVETTDLSEIDVAQVREGDPVEITFDALPDVVAQGKVIRIAPKSAETSGVNYTVTIQFLDMPGGLRWGMTAFVDIQVQP